MTAISIFKTMGNGRDFLDGKRFGNKSEYVRIGDVVKVNGVTAIVIKQRGADDFHTNLPRYSGNSDIYLRQNENGICQARVYENHKQRLDLDWGHDHQNKKRQQGKIQQRDCSCSRMEGESRRKFCTSYKRS